jgi:hypothetical protein
MLEFLDQVEVLQQHGAARAGRDRVLVVGDGDAGGGGQLGHGGASYVVKFYRYIFIDSSALFMTMVGPQGYLCKLSIYMDWIEKINLVTVPA